MIDRGWGPRAGGPNLVLGGGALIEYVDSAIVRRPVPDGAPTAIPSGFVYGLEPAYGGGFVYWLKFVDSIPPRVQVWTSAERAGTPAAIGEVSAPAQLFGAPDGVFAATQAALVHIDRAGAQTVVISDRVTALAATGDRFYAAFGGLVVRRLLAGGELEIVARVASSGQVMQLVAIGDRAVWFDTSGGLYATRAGSEMPWSLGTVHDRFATQLQLAASGSRFYVAASNVVFVISKSGVRPVAKARADIRAFAIDGPAIYALVEDAGLVRLCHDPARAITIGQPSDEPFCPPGHTVQRLRNGRDVCLDAKGESTHVHRDWYLSGDLAEERLADGTYRRLWADGTAIDDHER